MMEGKGNDGGGERRESRMCVTVKGDDSDDNVRRAEK
jgi:hypothetical protein